MKQLMLCYQNYSNSKTIHMAPKRIDILICMLILSNACTIALWYVKIDKHSVGHYSVGQNLKYTETFSVSWQDTI